MVVLPHPLDGHYVMVQPYHGLDTYARVFAAIGTRYGAGDGTTTFNLPNFQGVFPKGFMAKSQTIGGVTYANASGTPQADKMQGHKHTSTNDIVGASIGAGATITGGGASWNRDVLGAYMNPAPSTDGTNGTPRTGTITEPANVGVNFIIKL
jgi:microcystin-dependent protein